MNLDFPEMALWIGNFQAIRMNILVIDNVAIPIDAKLFTTFIPMTPRIAGAIGTGVHVDEKVLDPPITGPREGIAKP